MSNHVRPKKITLREVAEAAGVSISTASKALNDRSDVHPSTRSYVLDVAERLQFRPDLYASVPRPRRSGAVGLLTDDLVGRFGIPILTGAENAFGYEKTSVFLCDARGDEIREAFHVDALLRKKIDGLIIVGSDGDARHSLGRGFPVPVVYAYAPSQDAADFSIVPDNYGSAQLGAEHLLTIGCTRILHITGLRSSTAARDRVKGFQRVLMKTGLKFAGPGPLFGDWSESWGRSAMVAALDRGDEFDAVFAGNDQIARGCIDVLRERGRRVPQDVAVLGFDNWEVITQGSRPPISTIDMRLEALGAIAASRLFAAMNGEAISGTERVLGELVLRGSTVPHH